MTKEEIRQLLSVLSINYPDVKIITVNGYGSGDSWDDFHEYDVEPPSAYHYGIESHADLQAILEYALEISNVNVNDEGGRLAVEINLKEKTVTATTYYYSREETFDSEYELLEKEQTYED